MNPRRRPQRRRAARGPAWPGVTVHGDKIQMKQQFCRPPSWRLHAGVHAAPAPQSSLPVSAAAVSASRPPPAARSPSAAMNTACPMSMPPRCTASSTATAAPWPRTSCSRWKWPAAPRRQDGGSAGAVDGGVRQVHTRQLLARAHPAPAGRDVAGRSPDPDGYAAGMNAWIARVRRAGRLMPKEFNDLEFQPSDWTSYDVAMVYVGTMANRFSDANSEIDNLALLTALKDRHGEARAMQIFNQLRWMTDSRAPVTVPEEEGCYRPGVAHRAPPERVGLVLCAAALRRHAAHAGARAARSADARRAGRPAGRAARTAAGAVRRVRPAGHRGLAYHQQYLARRARPRPGCARHPAERAPVRLVEPRYTYGIGLHGAGFDVVGNTPFAYPSVLFGHNAHVAWGRRRVSATTSTSTPKLDPADRTRYFHDGQWKRMEKRSELILVKGGEPVLMDVYRSVHGLIVKFDESQHVAYAKARAWEVMRCSRCWPGCARRSRPTGTSGRPGGASRADHQLVLRGRSRQYRLRAHRLLSQAQARTRSAPAGARHRRDGLGRHAAVLHQSAGVQPAPGLHRQLEQPAHARLSVHRPVRHRLGPGRPLRRDRDAPEGHDRAGRPGQPATDVGPDPHDQLRRRQPSPLPALPATRGGGLPAGDERARRWWPGWRPGTA